MRMIEIEFPVLSSIHRRLSMLGSNITNEELALYVKRKDVTNVSLEVSGKKFEERLANIKTRLNKHFPCALCDEMKLKLKYDRQIFENLKFVINRVDLAANYFQMKYILPVFN